MLHYFFQMYLILVFNIIIQVMCSFIQENRTTEKTFSLDHVRGEKCELFCSCADFRKLDNVYCLSYKELRSSLEYGDYDDYDIFMLSFSDSKSNYNLTKKMLLGLKIRKLSLGDPDITVAENFLDGVTGLYELDVGQSGIEDIPNFGTENNSIQVIKIQSSRITSLDGKNLQNLTSLKYLSFKRNSIQFIDPDVLKGTENIEAFDLSHNLLLSIPQKLLDPMKKLKRFTANDNQLLHVDNLFSVTLPAVIQLHHNNITNANSNLRLNIENDWTPFDLVDENHYYDVCNVEFLDFSYNFIKELPQSFMSCNINKSNGTSMFRFEDLRLEGNELQYLTENDFRFVYKIKELYIQKNQIIRIDTHTFRKVRTSLESLDLSSNDITFINGSIRHMWELYYLNLAFNSIKTFADDEFTGLRKLQHLYLQDNQIKNLNPLQQLPIVNNLLIGNNDIKLIRPDKLPKALGYISFKGNPFNCDCHLQKFLGWLEENPLVRTDTSEQYWCLQSSGNSIEKLKECPDMCSCRCADIKDDHLMFVDCSSRNLSTIPEFLRNHVPQTKDNERMSSEDWHLYLQDKKRYPTFRIEDNVSGLNLENNKLEFLDETQLPPNLTHLYLSNNKLRWLPEVIFENQLNLKDVSLSGNPWNCDCSTLKFMNWLTSKHHIIRDIDNVRCGISDKGKTNLTGRIIWKLYDFDLCPKKDLGVTIIDALNSLIPSFS